MENKYRINSKKLADYLKENGIQKKFFASKVGVTSITLNRYISGDTEPSISVAYNIDKFTKGAVPLLGWIPS